MKSISVIVGSKEEIYSDLVQQLSSLIAGENDVTANLANMSAALKATMPHYSWVGFYLVKDGELVLGPFQGKVACVRIPIGRGVCGTAAAQRQTLVVPDVNAFPGHIACDPDSRSEIVVPLVYKDRVLGVLDVDSNRHNAFDDVDRRYLEAIGEIAAKTVY